MVVRTEGAPQVMEMVMVVPDTLVEAVRVERLEWAIVVVVRAGVEAAVEVSAARLVVVVVAAVRGVVVVVRLRTACPRLG
jgi:hypothetical protein